jgi:hypothetical protein
MKTTVYLLCFVSALTAFGADPATQAQFNATVLKGIPLTEAERQKEFIEARREPPVIALGKSDFVISGPLVAGFRKLPARQDLTRTQRFLRLPVIRLFVPGPMENPPGGTGKYFAWRSEQCAMAWPQAANRPPIEKGP